MSRLLVTQNLNFYTQSHGIHVEKLRSFVSFMEYSGYQYLVREPLLPMIASILLCIDAIVLIFFLMTLNMFSMGFKSALRGGIASSFAPTLFNAVRASALF